MKQIQVINASTTLTDRQVRAAIPAFRTQITRDFAPAWGVTAKLDFSTTKTPDPNHSWIVILDDSDQAGALGYHDITPNGYPLGKVFAGTDKKYGYNWTVTFSHELLEMLGDPDINLTCMVDLPQNQHRLLAYEVCDAVEDEQFAYDINGTKVSDFVYPAWFQSFRAANSTKFSFQDAVSRPFQLAAGGYIGEFDFSGGQWKQTTARKRGTNGHRVKQHGMRFALRQKVAAGERKQKSKVK